MINLTAVYECGFSVIEGQTRSTFQIHFYLVGLLFLVFDLEILLLMPIGLTLYQVSIFGFSIAIIFFVVLTVGFILEIGSGAISLSNASNNLIDKNTNINPLNRDKINIKNYTDLNKIGKRLYSTSKILNKDIENNNTLRKDDADFDTHKSNNHMNNKKVLKGRLLSPFSLLEDSEMVSWDNKWYEAYNTDKFYFKHIQNLNPYNEKINLIEYNTKIELKLEQFIKIIFYIIQIYMVLSLLGIEI